jgi:hypothetical protein
VPWCPAPALDSIRARALALHGRVAASHVTVHGPREGAPRAMVRAARECVPRAGARRARVLAAQGCSPRKGARRTGARVARGCSPHEGACRTSVLAARGCATGGGGDRSRPARFDRSDRAPSARTRTVRRRSELALDRRAPLLCAREALRSRSRETQGIDRSDPRAPAPRRATEIQSRRAFAPEARRIARPRGSERTFYGAVRTGMEDGKRLRRPIGNLGPRYTRTRTPGTSAHLERVRSRVALQ